MFVGVVNNSVTVIPRKKVGVKAEYKFMAQLCILPVCIRQRKKQEEVKAAATLEV